MADTFHKCVIKGVYMVNHEYSKEWSNYLNFDFGCHCNLSLSLSLSLSLFDEYCQLYIRIADNCNLFTCLLAYPNKKK
jgi:hypothetical protein